MVKCTLPIVQGGKVHFSHLIINAFLKKKFEIWDPFGGSVIHC